MVNMASTASAPASGPALGTTTATSTEDLEMEQYKGLQKANGPQPSPPKGATHQPSPDAGQQSAAIPPAPIPSTRASFDNSNASVSQPLLNTDPNNPPNRDQVHPGRPSLAALENGKRKHTLSSNTVYCCLLYVCFSLIIINIVEVWLIEHISSLRNAVTALVTPSSVILGLSFFIMLPRSWKSFGNIPKAWSKKRATFFTMIGIFIGTLMPIMTCQFFYLPKIALPAFRKVEWTVDYNNTKGLEAPLVVFSMIYEESPMFSVEVNCIVHRATSTTETVQCSPAQISGNWNYGFLVNFTDPITLGVTDELFIMADITADKPSNLQGEAEGIIPLRFVLIDRMFSDNISVAFEDDRYPVFSPFPWDSDNFILASIEQVTVDDTVNSLNMSDNQKYNLYNVISEPGFPNTQNATCFNTNSSSPCTVHVRLQVSPETLINNIRQSKHGTDLKEIFIDEGAIIGGFAFFAFLLTCKKVEGEREGEGKRKGERGGGGEREEA